MTIERFVTSITILNSGPKKWNHLLFYWFLVLASLLIAMRLILLLQVFYYEFICVIQVMLNFEWRNCFKCFICQNDKRVYSFYTQKILMGKFKGNNRKMVIHHGNLIRNGKINYLVSQWSHCFRFDWHYCRCSVFPTTKKYSTNYLRTLRSQMTLTISKNSIIIVNSQQIIAVWDLLNRCSIYLSVFPFFYKIIVLCS